MPDLKIFLVEHDAIEAMDIKRTLESFHMKFHTLLEIQSELNKIETIKTPLEKISLSLTDLGNMQDLGFQTLNNEITRLAGEIKMNVIPMLPETSDTQTLIEELEDLKQPEGEIWFHRVAAISSIIASFLHSFELADKIKFCFFIQERHSYEEEEFCKG